MEERGDNQSSIDANQTYAVASEKILAKEFDGEMTLINLDTGVYFAAGGPAVAMWIELASGHPLSSTARKLATRYNVALSEAMNETLKLLGLFVTYGLLVPATASAKSDPNSDIVPSGEAWSQPWLENYGDMQDLLLLDPVHDVSGGSWPKGA